MPAELFPQLVFIGFVSATAVQLFIWLYYFRQLAVFAKKENTPATDNLQDPVSIIICARNEAENLKKNLPRILNQNYRSFEVIVVDDKSEDQTRNILNNINISFSNLRVLSIVDKPAGSGKKPALAQGIKAAKHDLLLFTDADCCPVSEEWLSEMQRYIRGPIEIGLGYGPYEKRPGFLNTFIRYETFVTILQYGSFALAGHPYMGVGRNLIYKKELFDRANGFSSHDHIMSGDDDLFINQVATAVNTALILNKNTHVYSAPVDSWSAYYRQKTRHVSTGKHYKNRHKLLLGLVSSSHFFHYILGIILYILNFGIMFATILIVIRILVIMLICKPILRKLQDRHLTLWTPVLDAVYVLFYVIFSISLIKGKIKQWT